MLKLEVGKTYLSRAGDKVIITRYYFGSPYCFEGDSDWFYSPCGKVLDYRECELDLVSEVTEEESLVERIKVLTKELEDLREAKKEKLNKKVTLELSMEEFAVIVACVGTTTNKEVKEGLLKSNYTCNTPYCELVGVDVYTIYKMLGRHFESNIQE